MVMVAGNDDNCEDNDDDDGEEEEERGGQYSHLCFDHKLKKTNIWQNSIQLQHGFSSSQQHKAKSYFNPLICLLTATD